MKLLSENKLAFLILLALLVLYQLSAGSTTSSLAGLEKLQWQRLSNCALRAVPGKVPAADSSTGTWNSKLGPHGSRCESKPFELFAPVLEVEYTGHIPANDLRSAVVELRIDGILHDVKELPSSPSHTTAEWKSLRFRPVSNFAGKRAEIVVIDKMPPPTWIAVRNTIALYEGASALQRLQGALASPLSSTLILITLAAALLRLWLAAAADERLSWGSLFLLLLITSLAVHLRTQVFFYWDEWHVLTRYAKLGFPGTIYRHNEHFLPLFFMAYYAEALLFGDCYLGYLLVGHILHALNAVLLIRLLTRLGGEGYHWKAAARLLGLFFVVSALHCEVMQWAFELSVLLAQFASFAAMLLALEFVRSGRRQHALGAAAAAGAAPLFFGNGFSAAPQIGLILFFGAVLTEEGRKKQQLLKTVGVLLACAAAAAVSFALYKLNKDGAGHGMDALNPLGDLQAVAYYLAAGSQLGTVLRGTGLFPFLAMNALEPYSLFNVFDNMPAEAAVAVFGGALSLLLLSGAILRLGEIALPFKLWLLGQLIILSAYALPSLARWQFGASQALALRYTYNSLTGLSVLLLPWVASALLAWFEVRGNRLHPRSDKPFSAALFLVILTAAVGVQLYVGRTYDEHTAKGLKNRTFVMKLEQWNNRLRQDDSSTLPYEGTGSSAAGGQPLMPQYFSPGQHPDEIYRALHWLNPDKYVLRKGQEPF